MTTESEKWFVSNNCGTVALNIELSEMSCMQILPQKSQAFKGSLFSLLMHHDKSLFLSCRSCMGCNLLYIRYTKRRLVSFVQSVWRISPLQWWENSTAMDVTLITSLLALLVAMAAMKWRKRAHLHSRDSRTPWNWGYALKIWSIYISLALYLSISGAVWQHDEYFTSVINKTWLNNGEK